VIAIMVHQPPHADHRPFDCHLPEAEWYVIGAPITPAADATASRDRRALAARASWTMMVWAGSHATR
jgi:hypothetical protein